MSAVEQHVIPAADIRAAEAERKSLIVRIGSRFGVDPKKLLGTLKATAFRQRDGEVTDEQMMALLVVADQYKLNPFTKELYAFPDKNGGVVPVVGIDGWSRIINEHPQFDGMDFKESEDIVTPEGGKPCPAWIECTMHRKDRGHPTVIREYLDEVYRPAFKNKYGTEVIGPWQTHTKRFLRHKTVIQAARLAFAFVGIYDEDEAVRIVDAQPVDVTPGQELIPGNGKKVAPKKLREVVDGMLEAVKAEDGKKLWTIWRSLDSEQQLYVWGELRSWERSGIKKLQDASQQYKYGDDIGAWALSVIAAVKEPSALETAWATIQEAFAENDQEVPDDIQTVYQDRKQELGA